MGDKDLIPISDEQAKLARAFIELVKGFGGYAADVLSDLPKDLLGWLIGDRVKALGFDPNGITV